MVRWFQSCNSYHIGISSCLTTKRAAKKVSDKYFFLMLEIRGWLLKNEMSTSSATL